MTNLNTSTEATITDEAAIGFIPCYRLPFLSLFHADCMEIMKQYPDKYFDLAIVDPPYGNVAVFENCQPLERKNERPKKYEDKEWDKSKPTAEYWVQIFRISKNQIVWGGNYFTSYLPESRGWIYWDKNNGENNFSDGELAWTSFKKRLISCKKNSKAETRGGKDRFHPTQKPIYVYDFTLQNFATEGMKIIDTHFGSGSIALAVDKANRLDKMNLHLTACEIDKEYIDKAVKRISESIKQGTLSF
jgi:site-specific DNA-methyltransferase (adenine-specific)